MSQSNIIHLTADLSFLHTDYLWRMPGSWIGYDYYSTSEFYEDIARIAQRGVMDMLFSATRAARTKTTAALTRQASATARNGPGTTWRQ